MSYAADALGMEGDADGAARRRAVWRRRLLFGFFLVLLVGASAMGVNLFDWHLRYVTTDDAYVDAELAEIAPQIDGSILEVKVHDTQSVKRGDLLLRLDPADAQLAVDQARAVYEQAVRRVQQAMANAGAAEASVAARQSDLARAETDYRRRAALAKSGAVSGEEITAARNAYDNAQSALRYAEQALAASRAPVAGADVEQNPDVRAAKAALDRAELDLKRTEIRSPVDGIVAQSRAQIGQRVRTGMTLMSVVPVREAYVNANFKEVQIGRIRPGQKVTLTSDLYGGGVVYHGLVAGMSGGTGAALALIPAQNATGNWIKVVQRLPVRIALDPGELEKHPLRVGLSMTATVDVSPEPAPRAKAPQPPQRRKAVPLPKIALDAFVIDPVRPEPQPVLAPVVVTPKAAFARAPERTAEAGAPPPLLRTGVSY